MERAYNLNGLSKLTHEEVNRKIAFHEAGHAVAIYCGNQQKGLPPIFFEVFIKSLNTSCPSNSLLNEPSEHYVAKVEGGRLIHTLPSTVDEATKNFSCLQKFAYQRAFDADMINLLAGPIAEAIYVSRRDNEKINPYLLTVDALLNYGGSSDLDIVNEYLDCLSVTQELRTNKLQEVFFAAFKLVSEELNWRIISALANSILKADKHVIGCNDVIKVVESSPLQYRFA